MVLADRKGTMEEIVMGFRGPRSMLHLGNRDEVRLRSRATTTATVGKSSYRPTSSLPLPVRQSASSFPSITAELLFTHMLLLVVDDVYRERLLLLYYKAQPETSYK